VTRPGGFRGRAAGEGCAGGDIKGDFTVQIKIYHNRKGLRRARREGGEDEKGEKRRRRRSALFTIFNMQSRPHPSAAAAAAAAAAALLLLLLLLFGVFLPRARERARTPARPGMNKH